MVVDWSLALTTRHMSAGPSAEVLWNQFVEGELRSGCYTYKFCLPTMWLEKPLCDIPAEHRARQEYH